MRFQKNIHIGLFRMNIRLSGVWQQLMERSFEHRIV
jgi:hypothetical protein